MTNQPLRAACTSGRPEVSLAELEQLERELAARLAAVREELARRRYHRRGLECAVHVPPETREVR